MRNFYRRWSVVIVLVGVSAAPFLVFAARAALQAGNNDVRQWLPEGFRETRQYDWFVEQFGSEEMIVASWPGSTLDDPRLDQFIAGLAPYLESAGESTTPDHPHYFRRAITGRDALRELTAPPANLAPEEALRRLQGTLVGADGRASGVVIMISELGAAQRPAALEATYAVAENAAGIDRAELRLGGPTVESVALASESQRSRYLLSAISVVVSLFLSWRCLRQWRLVAMVFMTALLCAGTAVAIVYLSGGAMSLLLLMMPTLVYVLSISASVHLVGHYRHALEEVGPEAAPAHAVAGVYGACAMSALTTVVGLGSLGASAVIPVKMFGIYSAIGIFLSLPIVLLFLPAALQLWPAQRPPRRRAHELAAPLAPQGLTGALARWVIRWQGGISIAGAALMVVFAVGLLRLETSVKLLNLFSPQARIIQDYTWLENHLGPLVPVELVVAFDEQNPLSQVERMQLVSQVESQIRRLAEVGGTTSAATFAPAIPQGGGLRRTIQRSILERHLREEGDDGGSHYLRTGGELQLWRISARVEALNNVDYGLFIQQLREQVEPLVRAAATPGVRVTYTGIVPLIYKAQRALLSDLTMSFITAFLLIAGMLMVLLRGVGAGLLTMLPNVFPALLIFGAMGWSGRLCDIGSMMTASVALGIAVDDAIHYLSFFRRGLQSGMTRHDAILYAYQRCAGAMLQTTLICGLGLLVFSLSAFVPTANFAYLMCLLLMTALVGDLIFLPALLAGPLGWVFEKSRAAEPLAEASLPAHPAMPVGAGG